MNFSANPAREMHRHLSESISRLRHVPDIYVKTVYARRFARCLNPNLIAPGIDVVRFFAAREHR